MANPAAHRLEGHTLVRWSPAFFWASAAALVLVVLGGARDAVTAAAVLEAARTEVSARPIVPAVLAAIALVSFVGLIAQRGKHIARLRIARMPLAQLASDVATVFGAGLTPRGSGTAGAVAALPAGFVLARLNIPVRVAVLAALIAITTYATSRYLLHAARAPDPSGTPAHLDPGEVVADELVGVLLALAFVPWELPWVAGAFLLFRLFDIWKPGPVGWADRNLHGAWGVMFDDVIAGLLAGIALAVLRHFS